MKKLITILFLSTALVTMAGCKSTTEKERDNLKAEITQLKAEKAEISDDIKQLKDSSGVERYMVTIEIKQSHFSLDFSEHMKDEANAVEITIPVDKAFYNKVDEGTVIDDSFRAGSFWMKGSLGSWDIKVVDKEIVK